jgi:hypothetical protein
MVNHLLARESTTWVEANCGSWEAKRPPMGTVCAEDRQQLGVVVVGGASTTLGKRKTTTMAAPASPLRRLPPKFTQGGSAHRDNERPSARSILTLIAGPLERSRYGDHTLLDSEQLRLKLPLGHQILQKTAIMHQLARSMINVLRIWEPTAFDVNLTATKRQRWFLLLYVQLRSLR